MKLLSGTIEESILILLLEKGGSSTTDLHEYAFRKHPCTKQGFYRALRKLKMDEKVVVHKSYVSVSNLWRERLMRLLEKTGNDLIGDPARLKEGESMTFKIKGLTAADRLWAHLFIAIEKKTVRSHPLYLYNPHNWTALLRTEIDREHERVLKETGRPVFLTIGSVSALDKEATALVGFQYVEQSFNPRISSMVYTAVIGDYLIYLKFAPRTRAAMHKLFEKEIDAQSAKRTLERLDATAQTHIVVEKDSKKAGIWKRRLAKDFFVPKKFRDF